MSLNDESYKKENWSLIEKQLSFELKSYIAREADFFRNNLKQGRTLEAGCGSGRVFESLQDIIRDGEGFGIDLNKNSVLSCCKKFPNYDFSVQNMKKTNFPDNYFDNILLSFSFLGNVDYDQRKVLQETKRLLSSKGQILFSVYSKNAKPIQERNYKKIKYFYDVESIGESTYFSTPAGRFCSERFDEKKLNNLFEGFNLELEEKEFYYLGKARTNPSF